MRIKIDYDKKIPEKHLIKFLNKNYPTKKAENWDYVGYSVKKNYYENIKKILICLDVNNFSIEKAIASNVNLIISFHPFCFAPTWEEIFKYDKSKIKQVKNLSKKNINVFSIHTNFDQDKEGTMYWLNKKLMFDKSVIKTFKFASIVKFNNSFINLVKILKEKLKINIVLSNWNKSKNDNIQNIYIQPGAGDIYEFLKKYKNHKIDLLITSDIKWNEQQLLNSLNISFLIISHITENVFVEALSKKIQNKFPNIEIIKFIEKDFIKGY